MAHMYDVIKKLREIAERDPNSEAGRALESAEKMSGSKNVSEMTAKQEKYFGGGKKDDGNKKKPKSKNKKPDADGDSVPDWADKKPGKDDNKKPVKESGAATLGKYSIGSAAEVGKGKLDPRKEGNRIAGQKMADEKVRKGEGKSSSAKVAATMAVSEDVSITLTGSDATLAEILKLAGMIGAKTTSTGMGSDSTAPAPLPPTPPALSAPKFGAGPNSSFAIPGLPGGPSSDMDFDDDGADFGDDDDDFGDDFGDDDDDFGGDDDGGTEFESATTEPDPKVAGLGAAFPRGNDLASKGGEASKVNGGGNPMESLHRKIRFD